MRWKFWEKPPQPEPTQACVQWPTDSYQSARLLGGMFANSDGIAPFSLWRSPEANLRSEVEGIAEWGTKGLMLATWFWQFRSQHGDFAARMARDEFCLLLEELGPDIGRMTESLLSIIDDARETFESQTDEQRTVVVNGRSVNLPFHWYVAMALLVKTDDSPHANVENPDFGNDDSEVAMCLAHGAENAQALWEPMLAAIGPFNPSAYFRWKWSPEPGAFERHLQRRHNNVLFPAERRHVAAADVYYARLKDAQALLDIRRDAGPVWDELKKGDLPYPWHDYLNDLREKIDELYERVLACGGNRALQQSLQGMRDHVLKVWRVALGTDTSKLDEAEEVFYRQRDGISTWASQYASAAKPIPGDELTASLLTEPVEEIRKAAATLGGDSEVMHEVRRTALFTVMKALGAGQPVPQHREKLAVLGVAI